MNPIEVSHVAKSFGATQAVVDVSFAVQRGEIFGLLGPNGAGKTTSIRLILDIIKPEKGTVSILGGTMTEAKKDRIGYMPEERGLYQDISLERCLVYLATLKGLSASEARSHLNELLQRFELAQHRTQKVKELSKGMQQKAQIIATILHRPELVIIDEPFSSLDPINTQAVKQLILELQAQGATVLMSTHQMHQVEQLCHRILLIDHGRSLLYGPLPEIQRRFSGEAVLVSSLEPLPELEAVQSQVSENGSVRRLTLQPGAHPQELLRQLVERGVELERFEIAVPTLDEIFIRAVRQATEK